MSKIVTVYTRPTCAPCKALKTYLKKNEVSFKEIDIDERPEAQEKLIELSGRSIVPTTLISDGEEKEIISGLNLSKIMSSLAQ